MRIATTLLACTLSLAPAYAVSKESVKKPKNPVVHVCSEKDNSVKALACNIYKEARGESLYGQMAIGFVTINRSMHDSSFPTSVRKVVYQNKQFSWTNQKKGYKIHDPVAWGQAVKLATALMQLKGFGIVYRTMDITHGALYYHSKSVQPYWAHNFDKTVTIENHKFYKNRRIHEKVLNDSRHIHCYLWGDRWGIDPTSIPKCGYSNCILDHVLWIPVWSTFK